MRNKLKTKYKWFDVTHLEKGEKYQTMRRNILAASASSAVLKNSGDYDRTDHPIPRIFQKSTVVRQVQIDGNYRITVEVLIHHTSGNESKWKAKYLVTESHFDDDL